MTLEGPQEAGARAYVPPVLLSRIDAGQAEWLAELRRTTVVFTNITGMTDARLDALATLQSLCTAAQRVLGRYDGWLKEITMDDKGTTLIGIFGVPPFTHEDDPARAVEAALALQAEIRAIGLASGVGVATGPTFCGPVGNERRLDFAMLGGHVNLAARLMQAAEGGDVLCDAATRDEGQGRHTFDRLPAFVLKGMTSPVPVYRPRAATPATDRHSTLVDRTVEMSTATALLERVKAGTGAMVVLEGEPGIGKSRLVDEWLERGYGLGVTTFLGKGSEIELSTPYHPWRGVFERLLGVEMVTDRGGRRALVLERLRSDPDSLRLAPLLAGVLPVDLPDDETTAQLVGAVRADNTLDLLTGLLRRQAIDASVLVVLEDAQWFDSASWSLVHRVRREIPELLLAITMRPVAEGHPGSESMLGSAMRIRLGVLGRDDAVALAALRTGAARIADPVAAVLHERAEGNPLFIEQLTYAMRDAGRIVVDHGVLTTAPDSVDLERSIIPDTVQRVITTRLDQLPPAHALTLKVASVIGQRFELATLREIHPVPEDASAVARHLEALTRLDLIAPPPEPATDGAYEFRHKVTQEVAYNLMPTAQSRQLHEAVARWHEDAYAADLSPYHAFLAYHWSRAGIADRAVDHLELAGEQALRTFANEEAIESLTQAMALQSGSSSAADLARQARWHLQLGEAYVHSSRYREGRDHIERGLRLMRRSVPGRWRLGISLLGQTVRQLFHRLGFERGGSALDDPRRDELVAACRALERLAEASYYNRETLLPLYCVVRILNDAEASGSAPEIARGLAGTGALFGLVPLPRVAERYLGEALGQLARVDDLATHEIVGIVVGFYHAGVGGWELARERFGAVRDIARRLGDRRRLLDAIGNLSEIEYLQGSFDDAARLADEIVTVARAIGDTRFEGEALAVRAYCSWQLGRAAEAADSVARLRAIAADPDVPDELRIKSHGITALIDGGRGDDASAVGASAEALRLTGLQRPTYGTYLGHVGPVEAALDRWEAGRAGPDARRLAGEGLRRLSAYARIFAIGRPRRALLEGRRAWLLGRQGEALRRWRSALAEAERLAMPYEAALARLEIGRHLPEADPEREARLADALATFRRLGAARDASRAEAAAAGRDPEVAAG